MNTNQKIKEMAHHRNGVSGVPFKVAIVEDTADGKDNKRDMLVISFDDDHECYTAAFDLAKLDQRIIAFMENSWRGDHYHDIMKYGS